MSYIIVAKIGAPFGVRGWVKLHSYTEQALNLLDYDPWYFRDDIDGGNGTTKAEAPYPEAPVTEAREHGKGVVAHFRDCDDRDAALRLRGREIFIRRDQLPEPSNGEYYWIDLVGLEVKTLQDVSLGTLKEMMSTGANDVMVVTGERQRLIPYVMERVVKQVDLDGRVIRVDWDPSYE
ncbi:MAG: 16S rRNA processing protein RimM [Gammaproteobacteria bacterium]|nr:16S rRNA processing protein RimM [Gammaproteobacteria bacterium]